MKNVKQWKTSIIGLIALIVPVLVGIGWLNEEQSAPLIGNLGTIVEAVIGLVGAIGGVFAIFKLNDKTD